MADKTSHAKIRNIILKHKINWRKSKTVLSSKSNHAEYILKKVYSTTKVQHTASNSVVMYEYENKSITAKTHGIFFIVVISTGKDREGSKNKIF
jgi:hypothetical protein